MVTWMKLATFIYAYERHIWTMHICCAFMREWQLSSSFSFSHTSRPSGRGGGTGLLISPSWTFSVFPLTNLSPSTFEYHSVLITHPINLYIIVVYRPPGPLRSFVDELDTLLSSFPEDGTPLILLGDFNIWKPFILLPSSTETAFLTVKESLQTAQAASLSSVLILLDLSAAFDTVNHSIPLSSLAATGFCGTALDWIKSYLSGRSSQVTWSGNLSTPRPLVTGVPQGSVLGPLLFPMYTRSLGPVISAHGMSYHCNADDTQLFLSFSPSDTQVSTQIPACLRDIQSWMDNHHLKLNPGKMELIFFPALTSPCSDFSISLGEATVTSSPSARNLGVVKDNRLSLSENITAVT